MSVWGVWTRRFCLFSSVIATMLLTVSGAAYAADPVRLVVLGDSLSAGYGLPQGQSFPDMLQVALRARGHKVTIINSGVSGDTTAGGRTRLAWALGDKPHAAIVELGANDGLRALDPQKTRENLDDIITRLKAAKVRVLLTGMLAPPNLGREYGAEFNAIYPSLAKKHGVAFYPFFLDGVVADPALNQPDGIHPNLAGVKVIVSRIIGSVEKLISRP